MMDGVEEAQEGAVPTDAGGGCGGLRAPAPRRWPVPGVREDSEACLCVSFGSNPSRLSQGWQGFPETYVGGCTGTTFCVEGTRR